MCHREPPNSFALAPPHHTAGWVRWFAFMSCFVRWLARWLCGWGMALDSQIHSFSFGQMHSAYHLEMTRLHLKAAYYWVGLSFTIIVFHPNASSFPYLSSRSSIPRR